MVIHVHSKFSPTDAGTIRRHKVAQLSWLSQPWHEKPFSHTDLPRSWQEGGRALPYVKDLFHAGCLGEQDSDIIIYTNADTIMRSDAVPQIVNCLQQSEACYTYRTDFHHTLFKPPPDADFAKGIPYAGSDLVAFRARWWRKHRHLMPDMILSFEAWDAVIRQLVEETNPNTDNRVPGIIAHERHGGASHWENPANRYTWRGQLLNLSLAKAFFRQRDIDPATFAIR